MSKTTHAKRCQKFLLYYTTKAASSSVLHRITKKLGEENEMKIKNVFLTSS